MGHTKKKIKKKKKKKKKTLGTNVAFGDNCNFCCLLNDPTDL
jgi:hypothetical protein